MAVVAFDTLKLADRLEAGGFTSGQARAVSGAFADAMSGSDLATKADLFSVKAELQSEIASVRSELKANLAEVKSEILKWMFGAMAAQTAIILTVIRVG